MQLIALLNALEDVEIKIIDGPQTKKERYQFELHIGASLDSVVEFANLNKLATRYRQDGPEE